MVKVMAQLKMEIKMMTYLEGWVLDRVDHAQILLLVAGQLAH